MLQAEEENYRSLNYDQDSADSSTVVPVAHDSHNEASVESVVDDGHEKDRSIALFAIRISWGVNLILNVAKAVVFFFTNSAAILGSLLDGAADLLALFFVVQADISMGNAEPKFPVGKSRLEPVAVVAYAWFQILASVDAIIFAGIDLYIAFAVKIPVPSAAIELYIMIIVALSLKVICYFYCKYAINHTKKKELMSALARDHLNDSVANGAAIVCLFIADSTTLWWVDPAGASLIALWVICNWVRPLFDQYSSILGKSAPEDFMKQLEEEVRTAVVTLSVDFTGFNRFIAYTCGPRYMVEVEIAFDKNLNLEKASAAVAEIVDLIEARDEVERALVFSEFNLRARHLHRSDRDYFEDRRPATEKNNGRVIGLPRLSPGGLFYRKSKDPQSLDSLSKAA